MPGIFDTKKFVSISSIKIQIPSKYLSNGNPKTCPAKAHTKRVTDFNKSVANMPKCLTQNQPSAKTMQSRRTLGFCKQILNEWD